MSNPKRISASKQHQEATVLQLPAQRVTAAEAKAQERVTLFA